MNNTNSLNWRQRYIEAAIKIIEGRQSIYQCLNEAEKFISSGKMDILNGDIRNKVWNDIGEFLFNHGLFSDCERINNHFLNMLNKYDPDLKISKGGVRYNLGIAQLNQKNYDGGIINILNSLSEDIEQYGELKASNMNAAKVRESFNIFTVSIIDLNFMSIFKLFMKMDVNKKTTTKEILNVLPSDADRFLLTKSINIFQNSVLFGSDIYSKVLMFDSLKSICLILENSLRIKGNGETLIPLIYSVFKNEKWLSEFKINKNLTSFRDPTKKGALTKFEIRLQNIENKKNNILSNLSKEDNFVLNAFLKSTLLRNYTAHLFDLNASIVQSTFNYINAFEIVMLSLLYSLHFQS